MDRITRHSAIISTALHASLVAMAFWPRGCGCSLIPPAPPQVSPPPPAGRSAPPRPPTRLILASPTRNGDPPLPLLGQRGLPPLPKNDAQVISPAPTDRQGGKRSRGDRGQVAADANLPRLQTRGDDLIGQMQAKRTSNATMTLEEERLHDSQQFLNNQLILQIDRRWRHLLRRVTEWRLIIEVVVDENSDVVSAHLGNSTGSPDLDRVIDDWLRTTRFGFPHIPPGVSFPFLVIIPTR
jgi:outer membrane biosynthesis protein TonB